MTHPKNDDMRFCYLRDPEDKRRVLSIGRVVTNNYTQVNWVFCVNDPKDQFCRRVSRNILRGRMKNTGCYNADLAADQRVLITVLEEIATSSQPSRARTIAKFYLPKFKAEQQHREYIKEVLPPIDLIVTNNLK